MALEIFATPVVDALIKNLGSAIWNELQSALGVKDEIERLQRLLLTVNAVLEDAERKSISDKALCKWLKDLKDAALDAEDVLDEFQTEALHKGKKGKVRRFFSSHNSVLFRCKMAGKIKHILEVFDEMAKEREKFHLSVSSSSIVSHPERETFSYEVEDETFGRKDDKAKVMEWLIEAGNDEEISVLPIVGLGGLGKTTLAKLVYNDEMIKKHFEIRMWVFVGKDFVVKDVAKAVLEQVTGEQCKFSRLEDMRRLIQEKLANKRYLLILDDLWSDDLSKWETLRDILMGSGHGNTIVVTTRFQSVAGIMGTADGPYNLQVLTDDDCWKLFKQRAFGQGRAQESSNLVEIGKEIVKKCGGLPLAAKSLGGLMATKQTETEWLAIRKSEIWKLEEGEDGILNALKLSYAQLPSHLKRCFSYCSSFPKDFEINKLKLIQLWIAQGFIQPEENMQVEDIGNQYFNDFLGRSFFQNEEKDDFDNIMSCRMHDLIHDLACFVSQDESSSIAKVDENISLPHGCRYSSITWHESSSSTIKKVTCEAKKLRSLIFLGNDYCAGTDALVLSKAISNLIHLRALQLHRLSNKDIDCIVGKLKHLRFLELRVFEVEALPDSITDLHNLQTLNLPRCRDLKELPKGIKKMTNLRHLGIGDCWSLTGMPCGLGGLTNLQTLPLFRVSMNQSHGTIAELQHLNQIKGELKIIDLHDMRDPKDAREAKMSSKAGLQSLTLEWCIHSEISQRSQPQEVDVLEYLQPHPNLKCLQIHRYMGNRFPNWLRKMDLSSSPLPNLVEVSLYRVDACDSLPMLGQLPSLEHLKLERMYALKKIGRELYGESAASGAAFPSLKYMHLWKAPDLEEWSVPEKDAFPCLKKMMIWRCPKLRIQPCLPSSLVELEIEEGNEELLAAGGCFRGLSRLRKLRIEDMDASKTGWKGLQYLTALEELNIQGCGELIWLPEGVIQHHLSSLHTLELTRFRKLESLGGGESDEQEKQPPPPLFTSLHHLTIDWCPRLTALPEWLGVLTSLQSLTLKRCEELEMLPDGTQHLVGLKQLTISGCPILAPRCLRETGEDWHKIAHIPNLQILTWRNYFGSWNL